MMTVASTETVDITTVSPDSIVISGLSEGEQVVVRGGLALKALLLNHTSSRQR